MFFLSLSLITGVVGTIIVLKKMASVAGSVSHSLLASVAIANFLKVNPIVTSIPFAFIISLIIHFIRQNKKLNEDIALSIMWVLGVSIGIIFINLSNTYSSTVSFYLFGNVLFTDFYDVIISFLFAVFILAFYLIFNREIKNIIVDEDYSKIIGVNTALFNILVLTIVGLSIVLTIKAVGIILLIAIFTIPSTIAYKKSNSIEKCMLISSIISLISFFSGYYISLLLNLPISSTITIMLVTIFLVSELIDRKRGIVWKTRLKET